MWKDMQQLLDLASRYGVVVNVQRDDVKIFNPNIFQIGSPLRQPLLKFLIRYPIQTVDYFLLQLAGSQMNRLLMVSRTLTTGLALYDNTAVNNRIMRTNS